MDNLETIKKEKQEENFKSNKLLMQKDEELKKSKDLCVSLEKLMNEISAAEKKVQEKVTDKDEQLEVKITSEISNISLFLSLYLTAWLTLVEFERNCIKSEN